MNEKSKVLVLFSGGLDSTLVVKAMLEQDLDVEVATFKTPFCLCDTCSVESTINKFGIKVHRILLGQEYLDLVADPPRGYGSKMNPCIDCRIMMIKKAKELSQKLGAKCVITGEVLDQRPFSQTKRAMQFIERKAGMEGKILRPLSAKLLPETEFEKSGQIDRKRLYSIQGRRRKPQIDLAVKLGVKDYPCPSGGCLLTDPIFAQRLKDLLKYKKCLKINDVNLLKIGRHFRIGGYKFVVGRNEKENQRLLKIAHMENQPFLEVVDHMGPITLLEKNCPQKIIDKGAEITTRYSDVKQGIEVDVRLILDGNIHILRSKSANEEEISLLRI